MKYISHCPLAEVSTYELMSGEQIFVLKLFDGTCMVIAETEYDLIKSRCLTKRLQLINPDISELIP